MLFDSMSSRPSCHCSLIGSRIIAHDMNWQSFRRFVSSPRSMFRVSRFMFHVFSCVPEPDHLIPDMCHIRWHDTQNKKQEKQQLTPISWLHIGLCLQMMLRSPSSQRRWNHHHHHHPNRQKKRERCLGLGTMASPSPLPMSPLDPMISV